MPKPWRVNNYNKFLKGNKGNYCFATPFFPGAIQISYRPLQIFPHKFPSRSVLFKKNGKSALFWHIIHRQ
jgi:hypothetical protein